MELYKSNFLNELQKRKDGSPFFHLTNSKDEKEYIRSHECTYKEKFVYGGVIAIIKDKKTKERLEISLFREND